MATEMKPGIKLDSNIDRYSCSEKMELGQGAIHCKLRDRGSADNSMSGRSTKCSAHGKTNSMSVSLPEACTDSDNSRKTNNTDHRIGAMMDAVRLSTA